MFFMAPLERWGSARQPTFARSCCSAGRGNSPAQHVLHTRKGEVSGSDSTKTRWNITFHLSTTAQDSSGSTYAWLAKLLEMRIRMSKASRLTLLQLLPTAGLRNPILQRQQQAEGMEPAFENPDSERVKAPRKKGWVAVAKDLPLSTHIWK